MVMGYNSATFFILPFLGKHPNEYPRFRDCWISDDEKNIVVYTRVGGGNRGCGYGEEELYKHPNFISTEDDDFDNTFAEYVFSVPDEWKNDFKVFVSEKSLNELSKEYEELLHKVYPKLDDQINEMFDEIRKER
jgi:hypothetical protein